MNRLTLFALSIIICSTIAPAQVGTAFTYQGRLANGSAPIETAVDLRFSLWDASSGGAQVGSDITVLNTAYDGGIVQTPLDFGAGAFAGDPRWLEIEVRDPADITDTAPYTLLSNRVQLAPVPYAIYAETAGSGAGGGDNLGNHTATTTLQLAGNNINSTGNIAITRPDNSLVLGPNSSFRAGSTFNISSGDFATVSGGGGTVAGFANEALGDFSTVSGGDTNTINNTAVAATVAGGARNFAFSERSTIGGGSDNSTAGSATTISGGQANTTAGSFASVPGGSQNAGGGEYSFAAGRRAKVRNSVQSGDSDGDEGTFVWADSTNADFQSTGPDQFLIRAGGGVGINKNNPATALDVNGTATATAFVGDGSGLTGIPGDNLGNHTATTDLLLGGNNISSSGDISISRPANRLVLGPNSSVRAGSFFNSSGGNSSTVSGGGSTILGLGNNASGDYSSVGGGDSNTASGNNATVGGGSANTASGLASTVPGGLSNQAGGDYSSATGRRAKVRNSTQSGDGDGDEGTFIWADSTNADFQSTGPDQFLIRAGGGVGINKNNPATALDVNGTATATAFVGDGSGLTGIPGDNLGNHTATTDLLLAGNNISSTGDISISRPANALVLGPNSSLKAGSPFNAATGNFSTVGGGGSTILGLGNTASGDYSSVGGGDSNTASGLASTVPGGLSNQAGGDYSSAAGRRARVRNSTQSGDSDGDEGTFVWADSTNANFQSTGPDQFLVRASGGVGINKNNPATALDVNGNVTATAFVGDGSSLTGVDLSNTNEIQNIYQNIQGDTGSTPANLPSDTLSIVGGTGITTAVTSDTVTISTSGGPDGHSLDAMDGAPVDALFVDAAGEVGIGTTTPVSPLEVEGTITISQQPPQLDQSQLVTSQSFSSPGAIAQSFQSGLSGVLTRIDVETSSGTTATGGTFSIYDGPNNGSPLITSQAFAVTPGVQQVVSFNLLTPVPVVAGQPYTFEFTPGGGLLALTGDGSNPYPNGNLNLFSVNNDLRFETFVSTGPSGLRFPNNSFQTIAFTGSVDDADADPTNELQNTYQNISGNTGGTAANVFSDTLMIVGGTGITTAVTSDTVTISSTGGASGDGHSLDAVDGTPADALFVDADGEVGIGTASASQELHINQVNGTEAAATFQSTELTGGTLNQLQIAGTGVSAPFIGLEEPWTSPGNITADDNVDAVVDTNNGEESQRLLATNFGFSIPPTATILGVQVIYERLLEDPNPFTTDVDGLQVALNVGGSSVLTDDLNPGSRITRTMGGSGFLWSLSLTPAIVNSSTFGAWLRVQNGTGEDTDAEVDYIRIRVFYSDPMSVPVLYSVGVQENSGLMHVSSGADLSSPLVTVNDSGFVGINQPAPIFPLQVGTDATNGNGAHVTAGGTWTNGSSEAFKEDFQALNPVEILERLVALPITRWTYKQSDEGQHIGPTAEAFRAAFGLGHSDQYIATVDADGVALAAIQGLNQKLEQKEATIKAQQAELDRLRDENVAQNARLEQLEALLLNTSDN